MSTAGYSGTPLWKKLGLTASSRLLILNGPDGYFSWLNMDGTPLLCGPNQTPDIVHLFVANKKNFESTMKSLQKTLVRNNKLVIWVSWYKKASGIPTDITEDTIRNYALANGLVDVKVCAVSEQWSGLKLVVPLAKRK